MFSEMSKQRGCSRVERRNSDDPTPLTPKPLTQKPILFLLASVPWAAQFRDTVRALEFRILVVIVALGIHVHKYCLHWALKSVNTTYIGLFGSLGLGLGLRVCFDP